MVADGSKGSERKAPPRTARLGLDEPDRRRPKSRNLRPLVGLVPLVLAIAAGWRWRSCRC
jgi:hypothetical protein